MCPFCTEEGLNISDLPSPSQSSLGLPSGLKGSNEGLNPEACVQFHSTPQTAAHLPSLTLLFCKRSKDATLTGVEVRNLRVLVSWNGDRYSELALHPILLFYTTESAMCSQIGGKQPKYDSFTIIKKPRSVHFSPFGHLLSIQNYVILLHSSLLNGHFMFFC